MEMNELREELERHLKEYEAQNAANQEMATAVVTEEYPSDEECAAVSALTVVHAPDGYSEEFAADFVNLSPKWQTYLSQREDEWKQQIEKINNNLKQYAALEEIYARRAENLKTVGFAHMQDWLLGLTVLDAAMEENPEKTLSLIASCYGLEKANDAAHRYADMPSEVIERIGKLEREYVDLTTYLQSQKDKEQAQIIRMFASQKDADGKLQHPYFDAVGTQMLALLNSGTAFDVADAYEKATWINPFVREELIKKIISSQCTEAQKAQKAAFAPKGKSTAPERELTLREEIQKNMAAFLD